MCRNNTVDTYFNVIAVVNACQVGIDRVLIAEHPKRLKGGSGSRSSTHKKSKRVAIKKKKPYPPCMLTLQMYIIVTIICYHKFIKRLVECFCKKKEKCTIIKPPKRIVNYITPITNMYKSLVRKLCIGIHVKSFFFIYL